jgi:putative CocE/NonD family hydrolase
MPIARTLWNQRIIARDGTELAADVMLPPGKGPFPTVVNRTPYVRGRNLTPTGLARLVSLGYAFVTVDMRGRNDSDGQWRPFVKDCDDGHDAIEWVARQSWSSGRIGMVGGSYEGLTQWWTAASHPPHLRCIAPMAVGVWKNSQTPFSGSGWPAQYWIWWMNMVMGRTFQHPGAPSWETGMTHLPLNSLDGRFGLESTAWKDYVEGHIDFLSPEFGLTDADMAAIDIPVLVGVGWWDDQTTLDTWRGLQQAKSAADCRLLVGAWDHAGNLAPRAVLGGLDQTASVIDPIAYLDEFFRLHLKGEDSPLSEQPRCKVFRTGAQQWDKMEQWPPPEAVEHSLYLGSDGDARSLNGDGRLQSGIPLDEGEDSYTFDPNDPGRDLTNMDVFAWSDPPLDQRYRLRRRDVLVYDGEPLQRTLMVSGQLRLQLWLSSDRPDTDLQYAIFDVHPDGRSIALGGRGICRLRYRNGSQPELLQPGEVIDFELPGGYLHHEFKPGHRLRLMVNSSGFSFLARNAGTGGHWAEDEKLHPQRNTVYHGPTRPSRLIIPLAECAAT